jgi:predicted RNA-binding protein with PIN domain
MDAIGRLFNVQPGMDGAYVDMQDCAALTVLGYLSSAAGDTYTIQEATSAAGAGAQNLASVSVYYTSTGNGSDAWVRRTQANAATVVTAAAATQNAVVFTIGAEKLSDGYRYLKVTSTGAGTVTQIQHDLYTQRRPDRLTAMGV